MECGVERNGIRSNQARNQRPNLGARDELTPSRDWRLQNLHNCLKVEQELNRTKPFMFDYSDFPISPLRS